jgi:hypothetical protein
LAIVVEGLSEERATEGSLDLDFWRSAAMVFVLGGGSMAFVEGAGGRSSWFGFSSFSFNEDLVELSEGRRRGELEDISWRGMKKVGSEGRARMGDAWL